MSTAPGDRLRALVASPTSEAGAVGELLNGCRTHAQRMEAVTAMGGPALQKRLWDVAASAAPVTLADVVPPDEKPLREIIYHGKNSLPAFSLFQKRFCRPPDGGDTLWGYNHQQLAWLTGPGYFVVHRDGDDAAAIDYRLVPDRQPPGWPAVLPNDRGVSRFVYKDMVDFLRRLSRHVFIGRATRRGKDLGNYFLLCREG